MLLQERSRQESQISGSNYVSSILLNGIFNLGYSLEDKITQDLENLKLENETRQPAGVFFERKILLGEGRGSCRLIRKYSNVEL